MKFDFKKKELNYEPVFSIIIPSWNNLIFLQKAVESIQKNSRYKHQIIVHVNEGSDGTLQWAEDQAGISYTHSQQNSGVCYGYNAASHLIESKYTVLMNDDHYVLPDWDYYLLEEIKTRKDDKWCLSSTIIEPENKSIKGIIANKNYGKHPSEFQEEKLLKEFQSFPKNDWNGSQWYPMVLPTFVFRIVGGLSTEYFPGMYSDPDFMTKLWHYGVRYFKGVSKSRAYHFGSITTSKIKKNDGRINYILKWGMSANTFFSNYLKLGTDFKGEMEEPNESGTLFWKKRIDRWKAKFKNRAIKISNYQ